MDGEPRVDDDIPFDDGQVSLDPGTRWQLHALVASAHALPHPLAMRVLKAISRACDRETGPMAAYLGKRAWIAAKDLGGPDDTD